jgi:hypothetical protein
MKTFEEIQNSWKQNNAPIDKDFLIQLSSRVQYLKSKNRITIAVLTITMSVLIAYFLWVGRNAPLVFTIGLLLMITVVCIRVLVEFQSINKLSKIALDTAFYQHHKTIQVYHTSRLKVHQVLTPLLLIIYWIGFGMLLPTLKVHLSSFWFTYVWISSIPIAIGMVIFIAYHIKKERNYLKELQEELASY